MWLNQYLKKDCGYFWGRIISLLFLTWKTTKFVCLFVFKSHTSEPSHLYLIHHQVDSSSRRFLAVTYATEGGRMGGSGNETVFSFPNIFQMLVILHVKTVTNGFRWWVIHKTYKSDFSNSKHIFKSGQCPPLSTPCQ